jgi:hypothetical protein
MMQKDLDDDIVIYFVLVSVWMKSWAICLLEVNCWCCT